MRRLQNQKGFTLIEMIMVIVMIGVLATIAVPKYITILKDGDYAAVQGMVAALNSTAGIKFAYNRLCAETGNCSAALMTTVALLGAELDPVYSTGNYPKWTLPTTTTFVYTGVSKTWTCTLTAETTTNRAMVALPSY